jgi:hypothetical protein
MDQVLKRPIVILSLKISKPGVSIAKPLPKHLQKHFAFPKNFIRRTACIGGRFH